MPSFWKTDIWLIFPVFVLLCIGFLSLYAGGVNEGSMGLLWKQLAALGVGMFAFWFMSNQDIFALSKSARWIYLATIVLLLITILFAPEIRGAKRWLDFGPLRLQTSEIAKFAVVVGLSSWIYKEKGRINSLGMIARTAFFAGVPAVLVLIQPDLGSASVIMAVWFGILLISRANTKVLIAVTLACLVFTGIVWQYGLQEFQKTRVLVFLNPKLDTKGAGYNVRQSLIAIGNGGWTGTGLGQGTQSQLKFLPEKHTDFVFASLAEELGFLGGVVIIVTYGALLWRIWVVAKNAKTSLGGYLSLGVWWWMFFQGTVNIAMNAGLLPVTGIPLPLISYGGSALVINLAGLGLVQNIAKQTKTSI